MDVDMGEDSECFCYRSHRCWGAAARAVSAPWSLPPRTRKVCGGRAPHSASLLGTRGPPPPGIFSPRTPPASPQRLQSWREGRTAAGHHRAALPVAPLLPRPDVVPHPLVADQPQRQVGVGGSVAGVSEGNHLRTCRDAGSCEQRAQLLSGLHPTVFLRTATPTRSETKRNPIPVCRLGWAVP